MAKITVGILLYRNQQREVNDCLLSLAEQTSDSISEVLIRDQGGGECRSHVEAWMAAHPDALPINYMEGDNLGFGAGHNLLFASRNQSTNAYLCLNPDGTIHPDCLSTLITAANESNWRGIYEAIQEPIMHPKTFDPQTGETAWCSGGCLLIPNAIYEEIGGFDENFFLYCEDVDISWRVRAAGYRCFTCPDALFFHYSEDRSGRVVDIWRSACMLAHKWRSENFKTHALEVLASLIDVDKRKLQEDIERFPPLPLEQVYRVIPNFRNNLVFSDVMWTA